MRKERFDIKGMHCASCASNIEKNVGKLRGISSVQVNLLANQMTVSFDENKTSVKEIEDTVKKTGFEAMHIEPKQSKQKQPRQNIALIEQKEMKKRWWISFAFLLPLLYLAMGHMFHWPLPEIFLGDENSLIFIFSQLLLVIPIVFVNRKYFQYGIPALFRGTPNMDTLIAVGSGAALVYGVFLLFKMSYAFGHGDISLGASYAHDLYFESAGSILTLITLGKYLEAKSKSKTSESIEKLINLAPETAIVIRNENELEIPIEEVVIGDKVVVKPGQRVPVDGVVISGNSFVDESALTGESMPVSKHEGDTVLSATLNKSGYFIFQATKVGDDTTLSAIIQLVEEASASKAPISKLADRISRYFVPIVIGIAIITFIVWMLIGYSFDFAFSTAIAVLVISCPCALGLATPVAIMVGTGKGAQNGILIKSGEALEIAGKIDTVIFDKTGTITEGKPKVTDIISLGNYHENEIIQLVASLENQSEHPLAEAVLAYANEYEIQLLQVVDFSSEAGFGIQGNINGSNILVGNKRMLDKYNISTENTASEIDNLREQGKTLLFASVNNQFTGIIAVADQVKATSKQAITELQNMGIETEMLTGDNYQTARAIQHRVGITKVIAEVLPQDKEKEIRMRQEEGKKVAMVGDGINDAPSLTRADVGIAIGAGSDIAIESADIVLMKNDLMGVVAALKLSKNVLRNIKQNLFWAFFYNVIGIPLAAGVFYLSLGWKLNPIFAAVAMSLSSITVVLNALRINRFKV